MYQPPDLGGPAFVWGLLGFLFLVFIAPILFATLTGWLCGRRSLAVGSWRGIGRGLGVGIVGVALNFAAWWAVLPEPPAPIWMCLSVVPLLCIFVTWWVCRRRSGQPE